MPPPSPRSRASTRAAAQPSAALSASVENSERRTVAARAATTKAAADEGELSTEPTASVRRLLLVGNDRAAQLAAAEEAAARAGRPLLRIELAQVTSQYIGETEKNLDALFQQAEEQDAVLFLDEGDALLGRRTEVNDSHDRYANETLPLLQHRLDRFGGSVVVGTLAQPDDDQILAGRFDAVVAVGPPLVVEGVAAQTALGRRDLNLVRAILANAEQGSPVKLSPQTTVGFPPAMVQQHLLLMVEAGLLHGTVVRSGAGDVQVLPERLTWAGHDAYALMCNDARWQRARETLLDAGGRAHFAELLECLKPESIRSA